MFVHSYVLYEMYTVYYSQYITHFCFHGNLTIIQGIGYWIHIKWHNCVCTLFCSLYSVYSIVFTVHGTFKFAKYVANLYLHISMLIIQCTYMYVPCSLYNIQFKEYRVQKTWQMYVSRPGKK